MVLLRVRKTIFLAMGEYSGTHPKALHHYRLLRDQILVPVLRGVPQPQTLQSVQVATLLLSETSIAFNAYSIFVKRSKLVPRHPEFPMSMSNHFLQSWIMEIPLKSSSQSSRWTTIASRFTRLGICPFHSTNFYST